jgi:putative endonuclease
MFAHKHKGNYAETLVIDHLKKQGFTLIAHNYSKPYGEIDIIACKNKVYIFVEVKMRMQETFDLSQVITRNKQQKIIAVAKEFISKHYEPTAIYRFDVALVILENMQKPELTYIPNAFACEQLDSWI